MKRLPVLALISGVAAAVVFGPAGLAAAEAPAQAGWWTSTNLGIGLPIPPPPPDVPSNGLLIEGGAASTGGSADTGATAYAALIYEVPDGATVGSLTLTVAPTSVTTPGSTLELCPLNEAAINSEHGGPIGDAPGYNCNTYVTAGPSTSGNTYQFKVSPLVSEGSLAVAILPTSPIDRVVLDQPSDQSLAVKAPPAPISLGSPIPQSTGSPVPIQLNSGVGVFPVVVPSPTTSIPSSIPSHSPRGQTAAAPATIPFTTVAAGAAGVAPLVVALLIAAFVVGGSLWLAVGRAAVRRTLGT